MRRALWLIVGFVLALTALLYAQNIVVLLNTQYNAESTGNVLTLPFIEWWPAGVCENATPFVIGWNYHTSASDGPADLCVGTTATVTEEAVFDDASTESMYRPFLLPSDWTGSIDVNIFWSTTATSGNVVWQIATFCVADNETLDVTTFTYNTAQTITDAAKGTASRLNLASLTAITTTGCSPGELLYLKVFRNPAHASDTISASANFHGMQFIYRRAI